MSDGLLGSGSVLQEAEGLLGEVGEIGEDGGQVGVGDAEPAGQGSAKLVDGGGGDPAALEEESSGPERAISGMRP